jgi:putative serine protease PepD
MRGAAAAAALALAALCLAACGSGSGKTQHPAATGSPATGTPATGTGGAADVQAQFIDVVKRVSPTVVQISTAQGLGSGVVYDGQGHIVTNFHVVGTSKTFKVTLGNGKTVRASLVGTFPPEDLALIRLDGQTVRPATFGDSSQVQVGEFALAIGNPLGLRSSVTQGIVSSLGRTVSEGPPTGAVISSAIQTSAPINPGNSGGALVDIDGNVIGIPTLAALDPQLGGAQAPGIGFAIPANTVKRIADQLVKTGSVSNSGRAFLGVSVATSVGGKGVVVAAVQKGGPAARAGIRPGELIVAVDHRPTPSTEALATVLAELKPGQTVPVDVVDPSGGRQTVQVRLGQLPAG